MRLTLVRIKEVQNGWDATGTNHVYTSKRGHSGFKCLNVLHFEEKQLEE